MPTAPAPDQHVVHVVLSAESVALADAIAAKLGAPHARGRSQAIRFAIGIAAESLGLLPGQKKTKKK